MIGGVAGRAPHGARGLKFPLDFRGFAAADVAPRLGRAGRNDFGFKQPEWESRLKNKNEVKYYGCTTGKRITDGFG